MRRVMRNIVEVLAATVFVTGIAGSLLVAGMLTRGLVDVVLTAHAGEKPASHESFVHLASDCLTMGVRAGLIDSYGAVPGAQELDGAKSYTMTVQMGQLAYRFCYADPQARDAALAQVQRAVGGNAHGH